MALCLLQLLVVVLVLAMWEQLWFCWYFSVAQVVLLDIYVPQLSESCCPSSLLEGGPVQPVHHCADIRSIVVAVNLDEACSPSLYGFDLVNAFLHNGPI